MWWTRTFKYTRKMENKILRNISHKRKVRTIEIQNMLKQKYQYTHLHSKRNVFLYPLPTIYDRWMVQHFIKLSLKTCYHNTTTIIHTPANSLSQHYSATGGHKMVWIWYGQKDKSPWFLLWEKTITNFL